MTRRNRKSRQDHLSPLDQELELAFRDRHKRAKSAALLVDRQPRPVSEYGRIISQLAIGG